jgi:hypothetical protein
MVNEGGARASAQQEFLLEAGGLRVRFFWQRDRFAHEVLIRSEGAWLGVLASREGTSSEDWPPSPPLQHGELAAASPRQALLVGMAGRSHWSASVEVEPDGSAAVFDVACRLRSTTPGWLGSIYTALQAGSAAQLELCPETGDAMLDRTTDGWAIAAQASPSAAPQTARWKYRVLPG